MQGRSGDRTTQGRAAIVTGASRGLGRAIALALASDGDERLPGTIGETVAEIEAAGGRALARAFGT
jgi:7-alpha-hydroxysteroid dehydrogenase